MNIIVCVKVVSSSLVYQNLTEHDKYTINPYDLMVLQKLVDLKKNGEDNISCLCMGPESSRNSLVKCIAMGIDEIYWLNDSAFAGSDTVATTYILSEGIKKIGNYDLIVCGAKAVDGETGQVVFGLAKRLNLQCVIEVEEILEHGKDIVVVQVDNKDYSDVFKIKLPALIAYKGFTTVSDKVSLLGLKRANKKPMHIWNLDDLRINKALCGLQGSKTKVLSITSNLDKKNGYEIKGDNEEKASKINQIISFALGGN